MMGIVYPGAAVARVTIEFVDGQSLVMEEIVSLRATQSGDMIEATGLGNGRARYIAAPGGTFHLEATSIRCETRYGEAVVVATREREEADTVRKIRFTEGGEDD